MTSSPAHVLHTDDVGDADRLECLHPIVRELDGWVGRPVTDNEMVWIRANPGLSGWDEYDLEADVWLGALPDGGDLVVDTAGDWHVVTVWCCAAGDWDLAAGTRQLDPSATYAATPEWWDDSCLVTVDDRVTRSDG
jgi:hypothetical protein